MDDIGIAAPRRSVLRSRMVEEAELLAAIRQGRRSPDPRRSARHFRCRCRLAVPRPRDPETATFRDLEVLLRETDRGLEAYAVVGLEVDG